MLLEVAEVEAEDLEGAVDLEGEELLEEDLIRINIAFIFSLQYTKYSATSSKMRISIFLFMHSKRID